MPGTTPRVLPTRASALPPLRYQRPQSRSIIPQAQAEQEAQAQVRDAWWAYRLAASAARRAARGAPAFARGAPAFARATWMLQVAQAQEARAALLRSATKAQKALAERRVREAERARWRR